jgi:hypothetical protein
LLFNSFCQPPLASARAPLGPATPTSSGERELAAADRTQIGNKGNKFAAGETNDNGPQLLVAGRPCRPLAAAGRGLKVERAGVASACVTAFGCDSVGSAKVNRGSFSCCRWRFMNSLCVCRRRRWRRRSPPCKQDSTVVIIRLGRRFGPTDSSFARLMVAALDRPLPPPLGATNLYAAAAAAVAALAGARLLCTLAYRPAATQHTRAANFVLVLAKLKFNHEHH